MIRQFTSKGVTGRLVCVVFTLIAVGVLVVSLYLGSRDAAASAYDFVTTSNVEAGDVVVWDTTAAYGVKTTTSEASQAVAGVAAETVTTGNACIIRQSGGRVTVNVTGTVSTGDYLLTSTVAGKAKGAASFANGAFARAITDAGTPAAGKVYASLILGLQDGGSGAGGLSNVVEDTTPQLGDDLDAQSHSVTGLAGVTLNTGQPFTLGSTRIDDGSDRIDGEQVADDTIDDDSLDWGTGADQVSGKDVPFEDSDDNFTSSDLASALEELDDTNSSGPNASDGKVDWSQLVGLPAGFADGTDDTNFIIDSSFPASPSHGQLFYHTTHKTLFQYVDSTWKARSNYGPLSLYVDGTYGSDVSGKGYGTDFEACATLQYCWNSCVPTSVGGEITIQIAAGMYAESVLLAGKTVGDASASITIEGALTNSTTGTISSASSTTIVDAGASWTVNEHADKLLRLTGGTGGGQCAWILSNTSDTLTIAGKWVTNPTSNTSYSIDNLASILNGGSGNPSIEIHRVDRITLKHLQGSDCTYFINATESNLTIIGCKAAGSSVTAEAFKFSQCYLPDANQAFCADSTNGIGILFGEGTFLQGANRLLARNCGNHGIRIQMNSYAYVKTSYTDSNTSAGVFIDTMSTLLCPGSTYATVFNNETTGVSTNGNSLGRNVTLQTYNGCSTPHTADSSSTNT